jgi:maleylacetoacetate isomerase
MRLRLHHNAHSSASYRVRIALGLKALAWESVPVDLTRDGGEQYSAAYRALNPQSRVPTLEADGLVITQSIAILEWLEETFPAVPLMPADAAARARVRSLCQLIAADIQPLQNLSVANHISHALGHGDDGALAWRIHWISRGLQALETRLATESATGRYCHGDTPTLADCCLVPQCYAARRFGVDVGTFPVIARIEAACLALPAVVAAGP